MKHKYFTFAAAILMIASCNNSKLMYDISRKDRLYFLVQEKPKVESFALLTASEIEYGIPVKMLGMPKGNTRKFKVEFVESNADTAIYLGKKRIEIIKARKDMDFKMGETELRASQVTDTIKLTLFRTELMKEKVVSIRFRIVEDENFLPMDPDSSNVRSIISPEFCLYVGDGDPVCPSWWDASSSSENLFGWHMFLGNFYPAKYRKLLEFYHAMEAKNPTLYQYCVDRYGKNLDAEGISTAFFQKEQPAIWATYVLIPLYEYYKIWYSEHPDDSNLETFAQTGTAGKYWKNPIGQLK